MRISKEIKNKIEAAIAKKREMTGIDNEVLKYEDERAAVMEKVREVYIAANDKINEILDENGFTPNAVLGGGILALYDYKIDSSKRNEISKMAINIANVHFENEQNRIINTLKVYGDLSDLDELIEEMMNKEVDFIAEAEKVVTAKEEKRKKKTEAALAAFKTEVTMSATDLVAAAIEATEAEQIETAEEFVELPA